MKIEDFKTQVPFDWKTRKKYLDLPFPISEYDARIAKTRKLMEQHGLDALVFYGGQNQTGDIIYLSNFMSFGSAAMVLPIEKPPVVFTDANLHGEPINSYSWMTWVEDFRPVHQNSQEYGVRIAEALIESKSSKVGIVGKEKIPITIWKAIESTGRMITWTDFGSQFTMMKSVRSNREVALLKEIGLITAHAMRNSIEAIKLGVTENEIAAISARSMMEEGAHDRAFGTIINSGPKSGLKHSYPTGRRVKMGDMIYLDMGAMKFGYQSDMSRTVVVGGANNEQREVLDVVENAYRVLRAQMKPGVNTSKLIERAEQLAVDSGLREKYRKRIYLGLIVHHAIATSFEEFPSLWFPSVVLRKNMSFAFEPMAHILDFGTAVIEDCVLITTTGSESITPYKAIHW